MSRLLRDAELLEAKLDSIDGAENFGAQMVAIVKAKKI
jgi:vacuolar protein sorting-associated protein 54